MQNTNNHLFTGKTSIVCQQNNTWCSNMALFTTTRDSLKPHRLIQHFYLNQLYTTPKFSLIETMLNGGWILRDKLQN